MPDTAASFPVEAVGYVVLSASDLAAALAPVPWLHPAVQLVGQIILLCQNVPKNKHAANQLCWRCQGLLLDIKSKNDIEDPARIKLVRNYLEESLNRIIKRMDRWNNVKTFMRFLRQGEIAQDIRDSHFEIDELIRRLHLALAQEVISWEIEYTKRCEADKEELMSYFKEWRSSDEMRLDDILDCLGDLQNKAELESIARRRQDRMIEALKNMMQDLIKHLEPNETDVRQKNVCKNLVAVSRASNGLPPDARISGGLLRRELHHSGSKMYDIYIGSYMEDEKCAIKVLRTVQTTDKIRERFQREEGIWRALYNKDRGEYIAPFFGVSFDLGPFPVMVSKWMNNGNAIDFVRSGKEINWKRMIFRIAEGMRILHEFEPPIVHGLIRGSNILIKDFGDPVLSDFCLSKIMQDITGVPVSDIQGLPESYKWLAPEVLFGDGIMSTRSDIYSFSMTIIELITGKDPFPEIKRTPEFVLRLRAENIRPIRPTGEGVVGKGMDDNLWSLLCHCWVNDPYARPTIQDVLLRLPEVPQTPW